MQFFALSKLFIKENSKFIFLLVFLFRTTEQLLFITNQMSRDSKSRQIYSKELENIFQT